jgi:divinyl chlorophyllide a 8-vinyl-reductase
MWLAIIFSLFYLTIIRTSFATNRVVVAGATGYIGRNVVSELVSRGIPTVALVRKLPTGITAKYLDGAEIVQCDVMDAAKVDECFLEHQPTSVICCLASRSGVSKDAWSVDYGASANVLRSLRLSNNLTKQSNKSKTANFVLLSAYCCGKPELQFQFAKLKLEEEIRAASEISHSIVRATAFFKSLDGQVESVKKGNPILFFGPGTVAANAICEKDLANYLIDCAVDASTHDMVNQTRDVGGPDVPPITKRQQGEMIYATLNVPEEKRRFISLPIGIFNVLIGLFSNLEKVASSLNLEKLQQNFNDGAEIARIVRYYAVEPMVALGPGEVQGKTRLRDHFRKIAERGGELEEIDKFTTTTGVLDLLVNKEYVK